MGTTALYALETEKRDAKNSMIVVYNQTPGAAESFDELFSKGILDGRLRSNTFYYDTLNKNPGKTHDNFAWGVGGSMQYSTAYLYGFGATAGYYMTRTLFTDNTDDQYPGVDFGKAGKDTYARREGSGEGIDVLAVGYIEYKGGKTSVKAGRQIFESAHLRSNDTKMIPNTFQGVSITNGDLPQTKLRAALFEKQKLRDHRTFHSVIAYGSYGDAEYGNDDSGAHQGLSFANIRAAGVSVNPNMIVATLQNKTVENLKLNIDYMAIPEFFSSVITEANYKIALGAEGWSLTPGFRYMQQMDDGAGEIGGAALKGGLAGLDGEQDGYKDASSVDASLWAARLQLNKGDAFVRIGYSAVSDDADIIAPWRGFPTGGYTRSMAMFNWEANTKSWMIHGYYDFGKTGMVSGLRASLDYADMDYDDKKLELGGISKTDRSILHLDVWKTFDQVRNAELKLRYATVSAEGNAYAADTTDYTSYDEYRVELNYFF